MCSNFPLNCVWRVRNIVRILSIDTKEQPWRRHLNIEVIPLSEACGAEIRGVDLSKPLDGKTLKSIEQAWYDHLVIVFRDQDISNEDQVRFCRYFGDGRCAHGQVCQ